MAKAAPASRRRRKRIRPSVRAMGVAASSLCACSRLAFVLSAIIACSASAAADAAGARGDELLVDMREPVFLRPPELSDAERRKILAEASGANGDDTTINGVAHGAFTAPGRDESVYVLQRGGPQAADPSAPQGVTLAVFAGGHLEARLDTDAGNFIEASPDVDRDGTQELLLRADSYQMGVASTRLSLVSLAQGRLSNVATFAEARVDRCGDTRFGGDVEAAVIRYHAAPGARPEFATDRFTGRCIDGEPPAADKFRPLMHREP